MNTPTDQPPRAAAAGFLPVLAGSFIFLAYQYAVSLWRLASSSGEAKSKFYALATEKFMGFLIVQNLWMLAAYVVLAVAAALVLQPIVSLWTGRSRHRSRRAIVLRALALTALLHGYFVLRLVETRPYFLDAAEFGHWYYRALDFMPEAIKPGCMVVLFTILPLAVLAYCGFWQLRHHGRRGWIAAGCVLAVVTLTAGYRHLKAPGPVKSATNGGERPMNVIIIGSDSLRGDRLGISGYRPSRSDGPAAAGVSPNIDALARKSVVFENCYSSIGSTLESGTSLMASQYPHTHGLRHMFPDAPSLSAARQRVTPMAMLLRERGYDTAAIGDWCAGYYELMPLGFEHLSVSSFDNFKTYMSQAVTMAHFVVPLYFDNPAGDLMFPQIQSFANFVKPHVVTNRVKDRLAQVAASRQPFFWHVFYSCNHLPYRSNEPFASMFTDPGYTGPHRTGVEFSADAFSSDPHLEDKLASFPPADRRRVSDLYDGATRNFDDCVRQILESIKSNGLEDNTVVIITADHGDDMFEPGVTLLHGQGFNAGLQTNHVPMIVHVPGGKPKTIAETVRLIDVVPTLADLTGLPKPAAWEGKSFAGWLKGDENPAWRPFYGETGYLFMQTRVEGVTRPPFHTMDEMTFIDPACNYQFVMKSSYQDAFMANKQRCLLTRWWKVVCTPTADGTRHFGLFHMKTDPNGRTDLATGRPEVLAPMRAALERWMDEHKESSIPEIFPAGEPE